MHQVAFGYRVVVVECIYFLSLSEVVVDVLLHIERIHENKGWWCTFIKYFLLKRVAVLSVINHDFAAGRPDQPLIVRFQERNVKTINTSVQADQ